jgi:hypothetical protein
MIQRRLPGAGRGQFDYGKMDAQQYIEDTGYWIQRPSGGEERD